MHNYVCSTEYYTCPTKLSKLGFVHTQFAMVVSIPCSYTLHSHAFVVEIARPIDYKQSLEDRLATYPTGLSWEIT